MIRKTDYSLVHQHHQHMLNYIYKELREVRIYRIMHAPRLWLRKVDYTFVMAKYNKRETLDEFNN